MKSLGEIDAITDALTDAMKHVLMRCSEGGWPGEETCFARVWPDVTYGRPHVSFRGTVAALERRELVKITQPTGSCAMVALTREGLRVQATLRLRGLT